MLHLWHSAIYTDGIDPEARFPRERYRIVREGLTNASNITFSEPDPISPFELYLAHDRAYTDRFLQGELTDQEIRRIGLRPWTDVMVERTLILTHGTVLATRKALETRGVAGNMGGGTHHGYRDFGSGYCIFNDLAIAARIAQRDHGVDRILILDLDVHQGDGTASIFENDPSVRTVSFHSGDNFPFRKMVSDHDEVFEKETGDSFYLNRLKIFLAREYARFEPELLLFQAGVDGLSTDRLGNLNLTPEGMRRRNQMVLDFAKRHHLPLVITMGGGYGVPIETSTEAHIDLFKQASNQYVKNT